MDYKEGDEVIYVGELHIHHKGLVGIIDKFVGNGKYMIDWYIDDGNRQWMVTDIYYETNITLTKKFKRNEILSDILKISI